jgi:Zn-dependent M28 family amino/carboxypeptidase
LFFDLQQVVVARKELFAFKMLRPSLKVELSLACAVGFVVVGASGASATSAKFSGSLAFQYTSKATAFGERPSGSDAIAKLRAWIIGELKPLGGQVVLDTFTGHTPTGLVPMENIILKFAGTTGKAVVVTGHYDTKRIPMVHFVGANDAGSSTGFLVEFAHAVCKMRHPDDLYIVFFDGEEAVGEWTDTNSRYGSRHLVERWSADATLSRIKALINVDMIGDKDLDVLNDTNSSQSLREMVARVAAKLGDAKYFHTEPNGIDDDHIPFVNAGVNGMDVIDFSYGPQNSYWHNEKDTMDKLSAHSFQVVGDVVLGVVTELER